MTFLTLVYNIYSCGHLIVIPAFLVCFLQFNEQINFLNSSCSHVAFLINSQYSLSLPTPMFFSLFSVHLRSLSVTESHISLLSPLMKLFCDFTYSVTSSFPQFLILVCFVPFLIDTSPLH